MLISFLLVSAQFVSFSVIDSTLPAIGEPEPVDPEKPKDPNFQLSVRVTRDGFQIVGADAVLDGQGPSRTPRVACKVSACVEAADYDFQGLTERLSLVKAQHPGEEVAVIVPDLLVQYEVLVQAMDAVREDRIVRDADQRPRPLFPNVVIAAGME